MSDSFKRLQHTWESLGVEDPLWAIASEPGKKGNRWEVQDFLASGDEVVDRYWLLLERAGAPDKIGAALDFGCGVGRLSLAWKRRAESVTGVDISAPMIERGRRLAADASGVRLELNRRPDLSMFCDACFDLVFSHIVLQHMPWKIARGYLAEFARVCRPGGWIAFQLPSDAGRPETAARIRRWLVDHVPFGLGRVYRRWRRGASELFDMHFTSRKKVEDLLASLGVEAVLLEPDASAGPGTRGYIYVCRKAC